MVSVTNRITQIKQPRGGYINPKKLSVRELEDDRILNASENVHATIMGLAVDYMTRFMRGTPVKTAFDISLRGARIADRFMDDALEDAVSMANGIRGLDDASIINACKLCTFDTWFRNPMAAAMAKTYKDTEPDGPTIENIRMMVERGMEFWKLYGPIKADGFTFGAGYTDTVDSGDGDYLTEDTLWDFKVSVNPPKKEHTLQLLMYWIMGQHSGEEIFDGITRIGIYNPRLHTVYHIDIADVGEEVIEEVEREVIGYR